ncbi:MAG TPA: hypothetical protein VGM92_05730 [Candidatus Kapabacteria bacterium]|jgi:hypothetical protein
MTTTFQITANELDQRFLDRLKAMFRGHAIAITVSDEVDRPKHSKLPPGTPMSELLKFLGMISNEDAEEMKRTIQEQKRMTPEAISSYRTRLQSLRGILSGIDTAVDRDEDRV